MESCRIVAWKEELPMTTVIAVHEVEDVKRWLNAWKPGPGSRLEDFQKHGAPRARVFQSPDDPRFTGLIIEVEDLKAFQNFLASPEGVKAEAEDGVKAKTLKILNEVSQ
jgi:hypothetical protein